MFSFEGKKALVTEHGQCAIARKNTLFARQNLYLCTKAVRDTSRI